MFRHILDYTDDHVLYHNGTTELYKNMILKQKIINIKDRYLPSSQTFTDLCFKEATFMKILTDFQSYAVIVASWDKNKFPFISSQFTPTTKKKMKRLLKEKGLDKKFSF